MPIKAKINLIEGPISKVKIMSRKAYSCLAYLRTFVSFNVLYYQNCEGIIAITVEKGFFFSSNIYESIIMFGCLLIVLNVYRY